jgi:biopolymer transport protein ExbD
MLLSVVGLMFLLLPFLLLTTGVQKLVGLDLHIPSSGQLPPIPSSVVESLTVRTQGRDLVIEAEVRRSDVVSSAGEVEARSTELPAVDDQLDLAGLQDALRTFKQLDPLREQVLLVPDDELPAASVVDLMDAVRADPDGDLFPNVALGGDQP